MQAGQLEYFFDPGPSKLSKGTNATWLSDIWNVTVAQVAPIMPYVLLVLILAFRPMGLLGTRDT